MDWLEKMQLFSNRIEPIQSKAMIGELFYSGQGPNKLGDGHLKFLVISRCTHWTNTVSFSFRFSLYKKSLEGLIINTSSRCKQKCEVA